MSVLTDDDRDVVAQAIAQARRPRPRLTRTQTLAPYPRRPKAEKREPLLFVGLCGWCGGPAQQGSEACEAHADLLELNDRTSAVVTTATTNGIRRTAIPGSTTDARQGAQ